MSRNNLLGKPRQLSFIFLLSKQHFIIKRILHATLETRVRIYVHNVVCGPLLRNLTKSQEFTTHIPAVLIESESNAYLFCFLSVFIFFFFCLLVSLHRY